jgi:hypothetical protein
MPGSRMAIFCNGLKLIFRFQGRVVAQIEAWRPVTQVLYTATFFRRSAKMLLTAKSMVLIPLDVAHDSGMISPTVPI